MDRKIRDDAIVKNRLLKDLFEGAEFITVPDPNDKETLPGEIPDAAYLENLSSRPRELEFVSNMLTMQSILGRSRQIHHNPNQYARLVSDELPAVPLKSR